MRTRPKENIFTALAQKVNNFFQKKVEIQNSEPVPLTSIKVEQKRLPRAQEVIKQVHSPWDDIDSVFLFGEELGLLDIW